MRIIKIVLLFITIDMDKLISMEKLDTQRALGIRIQGNLYEQNTYRSDINRDLETKPLERFGPSAEFQNPIKIAPTTAIHDILKETPSAEVATGMHNVAKFVERTKSMRDISRTHNSEEVENAFIESVFGKSGLKLLQDSKKFALKGNYSKTRDCLHKFIQKFENMTNPDGIDILQNVRQKVREVESFNDVQTNENKPTITETNTKEDQNEQKKPKNLNNPRKLTTPKPTVSKPITPKPTTPKPTTLTPTTINSTVEVYNSNILPPNNRIGVEPVEPNLRNISMFRKNPGIYLTFKNGPVVFINTGGRQELPLNLSDPLHNIELVESGNVNIYSAKNKKINIMTTEGSEIKLRKIKVNIASGITKNIDAKNMVLTSGGWLWEKNLVFECSHNVEKRNFSLKKKFKSYIKSGYLQSGGIILIIVFFICCLYATSPRIKNQTVLANAF
jgi:hypothetical protein